MANLFGTDGVRGKAGVVLTAELALKLGQAAGRPLLKQMVVKVALLLLGVIPVFPGRCWKLR